jgi:NAD(P)-dependent dehydrogenase (short-subunit alcohol dehydrogenase family)
MSTVVITGSTQGIGRGLAAEFCHRGHRVVVSSRDAQRVADTVDALVKELKDSPIIIGKIRPGIVITEAVLREIRDHRDKFDESRKTMNKLADRVETVSPFLVDRILATDRSGTRIRWLTGGKIAGRMTMGLVRQRPDQFQDFGI